MNTSKPFWTSVAAALIGAAILLGSTEAAAAPTPQEKSQAATAYAKGKRLLAQNKSDEAVVALEEAVNLNALGKYRIEYAKALVAGGQLKEALGTLDGIDSDADKAAAKAGAKLRADLEARVPTLTVTLSNDVPNVVVRINDEEITVGQPTSLNPGNHVIVVEQGGESKEERSIVLRERDKRKLAMGAKLTATPAAPIESEQPSPGGGGTWWPAALGYGSGGLGVILGSTFGFMAFQKTNDVELLCASGQCPSDAAPLIDEARMFGNVSTGVFVTSAVALGAGVVLTFTHGLSSDESSDGDKPSEKSDVAIRSSVGPGSASIAVDF